MNATTSSVSSAPKLPIRCWKYLYMKLTSVKVRYQDDDIESELSRCGEHFKNGMFQFFSHTHSNNIELRENKNATFMESFYQRLSKILLMNVDNCKEIFANYLLYNCNNSAALLQERLEKNIRAVLVSVWSFYAQEQIFFLKCNYHIITSSMDDKAPYCEVFKKFLSEMSVRERYASLLKQYKRLIHQELPSANTYGVLIETLLPLWINYNLREQLELLHLIILVTSQIEVTLSDIEQLIEIIQITSFGRYQCFFYHHSHLSENQCALQQQIHYAITFYAVQILSSGWNNDIYEQDSTKFTRHNKIMYPTTYDPKQGPVVMAWILVLYHRVMNTSSYDEQFSNQGFTLLDEDLWKVLDDALHSNMMDLPAVSKVIEPVIDKMVYEMFSKFGMSAFKSHATLSSIIAFFCKFHPFPFNKSTSIVLQHFSERFPLDCSCIFKIYGAVLNWCTDIKRKRKVLKSLNHFNYTLRSGECKLKTVELNKYVLQYDLAPLKYIQNVRVPRGTEVIPDSEENIVTIERSLPIWSVMRNYVTIYLNADPDDELLTTVLEIINFVEISLQKVKTIDDDIVGFSELVLHVIWKTSSSCNSPQELNLLAACIKLHSVLFCIMPEDIIKCFEIYNFLPSYPVRMKQKDIQLYDMYYTQSRIYTIVCCKEAKTGVYPVLFSYLNFFRNVVQNMLTSWYTVAGLKFIFHVYNNVNNDFWKFKNLDERNVIIWNCIEVVHEILNHGLKDLYDKKDASSLVDFVNNEHEYVVPTTYFITRSCVLSILSSVNESTIMSTAIIGDAALLETIVESACWTKGKSAIFINIITYSLSLVQRCLIFVDVEKKLKKTEISFDHLFQPEKCVALLSYRYNCFSDTLCVLAIKLLIKLASVKENCMFSWLQYSNELLQKEFLYPLYSCNESNAVKSSLLSLMAVCIMKQIVIADALLEIDKVRKICLEKLIPDSKWQNLLLFTSRYIHDTETKPGTYLNTMHFSVLYVIYACWEKKLKVPQQYYKMSDDFWKCVTLPLHGEPSESFNGYGFILEIVSLEIVGSKTIDTKLKAVLKSFLNSEHFLKWTTYCSGVIDEVPRLSIEFETVPIPASAVAESWKKFVQVVTSHCSEFVEEPGKTAFPIFENLIEELCNMEYRKKEKFLCDIYRIYLSTWEKSCSESQWRKELHLMGKMFIFLDEKTQDYSAPYFFSALLEVAYKILKFGREHISVLNELENKSDFLIACSNIVNHKLKDFTKLISDESAGFKEYPPLLLHLCIFVNIINSLEVTDELMAFMLRETDFMNLVLETTNKVLAISCGTKTAKMLLQFQNFIFEKYPFLKTNFWRNDSIVNVFQTIFPGEVSSEQLNHLQTFTESERNNLFRFGLNFTSNLTVEVSNNSKVLLIDFHSRNKQYLFAILRMISVTLRKEDLYLIIAAVAFYRRISQHIYYCTFNEVDDLTESMFLLFNCVKTAVSMLIQPSKMSSILFNVPIHHLQQFFEDSENVSSASKIVKKTYNNLMYLVRMGIQTLSTFCVAAETVLHGAWPPEDWNFRWLNKIKNRDDCLFPLLLFDHDSVQEDFTVLATFITLEHRAVTKRTIIESPTSVENLASNKLMLLDYDESGETLLELSIFLFSQSAMYLLHPQIDQSKKLFFVNQIFVNLKEFIRSALSDRLSEQLEIPSCFDDHRIFQAVKEKLPKDSEDMETDESSSASVNSTIYEDQSGKIMTATLNVVAGLFYKIITTFKHS